MLKIVGDWKNYLEVETPAEEESRLERHARSGRPLGDVQFLEHAERISGRCLRPGKPGPKAKQKARKSGRRKTRKSF